MESSTQGYIYDVYDVQNGTTLYKLSSGGAWEDAAGDTWILKRWYSQTSETAKDFNNDTKQNHIIKWNAHNGYPVIDATNNIGNLASASNYPNFITASTGEIFVSMAHCSGGYLTAAQAYSLPYLTIDGGGDVGLVVGNLGSGNKVYSYNYPDSTGAPITDNVWSIFTFDHRGGRLKIWKDNSAISDVSSGNTSGFNSPNSSIGYVSGPLGVSLTAMGFWNTSLSTNDFTNVFNWMADDGIVPNTPTPTSTITVTYTITPTITISPTSTASPTVTPTPLPTPSYLFWESFHNTATADNVWPFGYSAPEFRVNTFTAWAGTNALYYNSFDRQSISDNAANGGFQGVTINPGNYAGPVTILAQIGTGQGDSHAECGIKFRVNPNNPAEYFLFSFGSRDKYPSGFSWWTFLYKGAVLLASHLVTDTEDPGDAYHPAAIIDNGNHITCFFDVLGNTPSSQVFDYSSTDYNQNKYVGIWSYGNNLQCIAANLRVVDGSVFTPTPTPLPSSSTAKHKAWSRGWYWGW